MSETKDQTIARLEGELAASRELGPCKHPKMFITISEPYDPENPDASYHCTICAELAESRADALESALKEAEESYNEANILRATEETAGNVVKHAHATGIMSGINITRSILLDSITPTDAAARDERDRRIRLEEHELSCFRCKCCERCKKHCKRGNELRAPVPAEGEK